MAVDRALVRVNLGGTEAQFFGVVVSRRGNAAQDVSELCIVVEQAQQRFTVCTVTTDPEYVFRRRVEVDDEQILVEQDDA